MKETELPLISVIVPVYGTEKYFDRAIEIFYELRLPEDIAEVYYNRSLNYIMQEHYAEAEHDLLSAMKVIEKLHLNSLRVCNLSKLYALLALVGILQKDRFTCERYMLSCRQFLNYLIEKEKKNQHEEIIHDYAKCDDDMFLYTFAQALLNQHDGNLEEAYENFERAEHFLTRAEGNQFFSYRIFRRARMNLFKQMGRSQLYEREEELLRQHEEMCQEMAGSVQMDMLKEIDPGDESSSCRISDACIETLVKQEGLARDFQSTKRQMEFLSTWQKLIDVTNQKVPVMVQNAISCFINHFNLDCALYICYQDRNPNVLYNDTGRNMSPEILRGINRSIKEYPQGFVVSKIGEGFLEHQVTYVRMKDNWHGSIERYMLNEDDLNIYQLLFREMEYSINRIEAYEKAYEMNRKLQAAAVTDMLTGIYNRAGMYQQLGRMEEQLKGTATGRDIGLMFIDLDNFKHYNDTYGHDVGDLILKEMAVIFKEVSLGKGFVSRFGGDEFIIILETNEKDALEKIAKDIYARINETEGFKKQIEEYLGHEITVDAGRLITCSIGIASAANVHSEDEIDELIRRADDLLYTVKMGEKGHYKFL